MRVIHEGAIGADGPHRIIRTQTLVKHAGPTLG